MVSEKEKIELSKDDIKEAFFESIEISDNVQETIANMLKQLGFKE